MLPASLQLEFILRILLSCVCGVLVGFERSKRLKEAGVRTHCMVACGAALLMIVSKYGFADLTDGVSRLYGSSGADSARVAAQVVTGVGFLGAGVIVRTGMSIKGLTTAAGVWTTAALGLALGGGMYFIGLAGTGLIMAAQYLMHRFSIGSDAYTIQEIKMRFQDFPPIRERLFRLLDDRGGVIGSCSVNKSENGEITYDLAVRIRNPITARELQQLMDEYEQVHFFSV